ncbi:MAG: ribosome maturation factor RimP [Erysipelotrichaceae bacterium]|nr:ribosome maturation factor RimP [Erysipelotrichaceae bacterium]
MLEKITELIQPILERYDCYLDDIEYQNEKNEWYLRIFIDKNHESLDIDTCAAVSEDISALLDEVDMIQNEYYLEVSSPGAEKPLKTLEQVKKAIGEYVYIKLKNPKKGMNDVYGTILNVDDENNIDLQYLSKNINKNVTISYENVSFIRLAVKF